jgi:hypothetical protein
MATEYLKPMLDVGSPRVFNCNVMTRRILADDPAAPVFFRNKPMNRLVLIKDAVPESESRGATSSIGTKLYFPFNENDIYEGGRTIFAHDRHMESALADNFGQGALKQDALAEDMRILKILDKLPSLDPFLLKDVFRNEGVEINAAYFEVGKELWREIETYILQSFEPLVQAAFPNAVASDEKARALIEKIWEGRDLDTLRPLAAAFQLPQGQELEIFTAWKGINFYAFQFERAKPLMLEMMAWLKDLQIPVGAVSAAERNEMKASLEATVSRLRSEWQLADNIIRDYQSSYDKLFKQKIGSADFLAFLKKSNKAYWDIGNALGKTGHATYCWDVITKRHPNRKLPWEPLREIINMLGKIFSADKKPASNMSW